MEHATYVDIQGPSKIVYSPDNPLELSSSVLWVETAGQVITDTDEGVL